MFSFWNNIFLNADLCILKVKHFQCHRHVLFTMTCYNFKMDFNCTLLLCYHNDIYFWQNKRIELQSQRCLNLVQLGHSLLPSFHNMRSNKEGRFKNDIVITSDYFSSSINSSVFKKNNCCFLHKIWRIFQWFSITLHHTHTYTSYTTIS